MNLGAFPENILESDLTTLMRRWRKIKFCGNIKVLVLDDFNELEIILFEDCNLFSIKVIMLQCPYLSMVISDEEDFFHTGVNLEIEFLFVLAFGDGGSG